MWVVLISCVIELFFLLSAIPISSSIIAYWWFSFPGDFRESEVGANTGCYNTFRYFLVVVIETGLFQRTYMNNIAHILFVGISFWFRYRSYHWCFHRVTYGWQHKNERDIRRTETHFGNSGFTSWSIYANGSTIWQDWSAIARVESAIPEISEGLFSTAFQFNCFSSSLYELGFSMVQTLPMSRKW